MRGLRYNPARPDPPLAGSGRSEALCEMKLCQGVPHTCQGTCQGPVFTSVIPVNVQSLKNLGKL